MLLLLQAGLLQKLIDESNAEFLFRMRYADMPPAFWVGVDVV